jgi:hypothetical protein
MKAGIKNPMAITIKIKGQVLAALTPGIRFKAMNNAPNATRIIPVTMVPRLFSFIIVTS